MTTEEKEKREKKKREKEKEKEKRLQLISEACDLLEEKTNHFLKKKKNVLQKNPHSLLEYFFLKNGKISEISYDYMMDIKAFFEEHFYDYKFGYMPSPSGNSLYFAVTILSTQELEVSINKLKTNNHKK